jgi:hypothetical protein
MVDSKQFRPLREIGVAQFDHQPSGYWNPSALISESQHLMLTRGASNSRAPTAALTMLGDWKASEIVMWDMALGAGLSRGNAVDRRRAGSARR